MPVGTQRAASALFVVLGRIVCSSRTLHAASLPTLSSFNVIIRLRSPLTTVPLRQGRRGAKRRRGWIKHRSPLIRSSTHRSSAHPFIAHRSPLIRSPLIRSSAHRSYILYNKVCLPFCAYLLSFLHSFLQFS